MFQNLFPEIAVEKQHAKASWTNVLMYTLVFLAAMYVLKTLNIAASSGITDLTVIFIPGFIIYWLAPVRYRPFIYCLIFIGSLFYVFSWVTAAIIAFFLSVTAYVVYSGYKLPLKYVYLILLAIAFNFLRNSFLLRMPRLNMSIPFVAAILMFRVIVLMYEVKYNKLPENRWLKLSYFFCFPNLAFLFYPIIDYKTYTRGYMAEPFEALCNKSLWYMISGIMFLAAYKLLGFYLDVSFIEVHDITGLIVYMLSKYILVFKMIGLLTLGLSFLCMFGFNMPMLFGNFFVVTSFNHYWQRVNIYWKDFIVKIVYYPLYFRYRKKLKNATALLVFVAVLSSWFFHMYQQFWISGMVLFRLQDFMYWLILATLVASNVHLDTKAAKKKKEDAGMGHYLFMGLRFVIVFTTMLVCWVLWNSDDVSSFSYVMSRGLHASPQQVLSLTVSLVLIITCFALYLRISSKKTLVLQAQTRRRTVFSLVMLCLLCILSIFKPQLAKNQLVAIISSKNETNRDEQNQKEINYYSSVTSIKNDWEVGLSWGDNRSIFGQIGSFSNDLMFQELKPHQHSMFKGQEVVSNSYGLRDKDYPLVKEPGTYRIALLGGSYEMGSGVAGKDVFEKVLEDSLNKYLGGHPKIEIINFGMGSFTTVPQTELLRSKVLKFHPDQVMEFYHTDELGRATRFFARYISNGVDLKYDYLLNVKAKAGVKQSMSNEEIIARISPYMRGVTVWCFQQMDSICKANHIKEVGIFLPTTNDLFTEDKVNDWKDILKGTGFEPFVLRNVYDGYEHSKIAVSDDDPHPNALGHHLIANKLFNLLTDSTTHIIPLK